MAKQQTLARLLGGLSKHGDRPAVLALREEGAESWSYADLAERSGRLAGGLAEAGVAPGDRVALLANNRPQWVAACLGVMWAGAVPVPLDVQLADDVLAHVLRDSGARLLFTTGSQLGRLDRLGEPARMRRALLDAGADEERGWERLLTGRAGEMPAFGTDTPAALFYTSGTTGLPKGSPSATATWPSSWTPCWTPAW
jgi:long-chain acyl-CoA synthetase